MKSGSTPDDQTLQQLAHDLIHRQSTMTLATAGGDGAWAAPVYYVFNGGAFYFFSNPQSRHIRQSASEIAVSAAIHASTDSWQGIQGIQMSGAIHPMGPEIAAFKPVNAYIKKFPFIKEFFKPGQKLDLAGFGQRFKVKFYRFEADVVLYQDNRIRFGFRTQVQLT